MAVSDAGAASGRAPHIHHCPHVREGIASKEEAFLGRALAQRCEVCAEPVENWLCAKCYRTFCGRHAQGHMLEHTRASGHLIVVSPRDLSYWCYGCDSYVSHLHLRPVYNHYSALHRVKFKEDMPQPFEGRDDEGKDAAAAAGPARPPSPPAASERAQAAPAAAWEVEGLPREALANPVVDRVLGCLYGNALGDAYGLSTEFLNAEEVARMYPDGAAIPFPDYQRTFHSSRWKRGDWTDDTDQMILITQALVAHAAEGEAAVARDFAARLRRWAREGFPELGDTGGAGLGFTVGSVISHPRFLEAPHEAARAVWEYHRRDLAANGAVMRTSVLGCYRSEDLERVRQQTEALALVTHTDPRCVASCVAVTRAIAQLVRGRPASTPEEVEALLGECAQYALRYFDNDERRREFLGYMGARSVADLRLDEPRKIGYTLKCAGSGFFVMRSGLGFKEALLEVVRQGGDADTNGAVCGAMLGARMGYAQLPREWLAAMPDKRFLDRNVVAFLRLCKLIA